MEADSPPSLPSDLPIPTSTNNTSEQASSCFNTPATDTPINALDETESDVNNSVHAFNISHNLTVIERRRSLDNQKTCEGGGSDSGVEVLEIVPEIHPVLDGSANVQSCDSSIISCYSNYEEAYNLLVRKNSTLLNDYTSENGSESSSISAKSSSRRRNLAATAKKKVSVTEAKTKSTVAKERSRSKPPTNTNGSLKTPAVHRLKSVDRQQGKTASPAGKPKTPSSLDFKGKKPASVRNSSATRTPSDDGRWPSINSKPAPLMSRSLRLETPPKGRLTQMDSKTIEKYATLPRRKKEPEIKANSRDNSTHRSLNHPVNQNRSTPAKVQANKLRQRTKIYHEIGMQTALTMTDVEKALGGEAVSKWAQDVAETEKVHKSVQVDLKAKDLIKLREELKILTDKYNKLNEEHKEQSLHLKQTQQKLEEEILEKASLQKELQTNSERVLAILGNGAGMDDAVNENSDSLMILETRFQNVGHVVIQQEQEISRLNNLCRSLQKDLEKSLAVQKSLMQQQQELEAESAELQEFLQNEKNSLGDALKESEAEIKRLQLEISTQRKIKDAELEEKMEECKHLVRLSEQRRQENLGLQAKLMALEAKSRDLLVHQGSSVSGAAVALSALIRRMDGLVGELIAAYNISDQELEEVIYINEVYNNSSSSPESTPEKSKKFPADKTPSPKVKNSFVSAVINAIKNAAATPFAHNRDISRDNLYTDHSSSNEMLDSETEPCLMMEHVLEDVVVPDGHSHNMVSTQGMMSNRLTHSESLKDLSQAILNRQKSEQQSLSYAGSLSNSFTGDLPFSEIFPSISLVDQVIDVDNVITRLLKVIRIIQMENDDLMNEVQEQRDSLSDQVDKYKESHKLMAKQLKDWECLSARLQSETKELMAQVSRKNAELDKVKTELNDRRDEVEKLNQDVCELSTALAKVQMEKKQREDEVEDQLRKWERTGDMPTADVLAGLVAAQNEIPILQEKLKEKQQQLKNVTQEFLNTKQILTESLKNAINETKKQYHAIDKALEVFHEVQPIIHQNPQLAKLQHELEELNFQTASSIPLVMSSMADCNANDAALRQAVANLEIAAPINTTA